MFGGESKRPLRGKGAWCGKNRGVHVISIHAPDSKKLRADLPSAKNLIRGREDRVPAYPGPLRSRTRTCTLYLDRVREQQQPASRPRAKIGPPPSDLSRGSIGYARLLLQEVALEAANL